MKILKCIGIWMDHANANLIEFTTDPIETKTLHTEFTHTVKEQTLKKSEVLMHHKEQHENAEYYKELAAVIKHYDEVLLFGPTDAKVELHNLLLADHRFANIKIDVERADRMTENQQHAFVKKHFSRH